MEAIAGKNEIIKQLREKILSMEGFSTGADNRQIDFGLGSMNAAFPRGVFPVGAIHDFSSPDDACAAASNGFIANLLGTLLQKGGLCLWIAVGRKVFPPALKAFGIEPHRIVFVDLKLKKDALWVVEQALKCREVAAVVAELRDVSFAESRRLQLAIESSRVTGFLHRRQPLFENTLACAARWRISPLPSRADTGLPGVGFPRVRVELEKIRSGRPGVWEFEWQNGKFRVVPVQKPARVPSRPDSKKRTYA